MKYRKKPVVIEAFRLGYDDIPNWFLESDDTTNIEFEKRPGGNVSCDIHTLEGIMKANKGDYIILGVNQEIYPCKADIFEKTYEEVK